jgi:hypothetical protein
MPEVLYFDEEKFGPLPGWKRMLLLWGFPDNLIKCMITSRGKGVETPKTRCKDPTVELDFLWRAHECTES